MGEPVELIEWEAPGPYRVVFSTRRGGVSEGPYAALNLGLLTGDDPACVRENRRLLFEAAGADPEHATMAHQRHSACVREARPTGVLHPRAPFEACDGLWTRTPGLAVGLVTADCLPIALVATHGEPGLSVVHAGWRGLLGGIVAEAVRSLGPGPLAAVVGPGIGPCCYEVGEEVAAPFRAALGADVAPAGRLDLWTSAERQLERAGCASVERLDLCTACDAGRFFSHRRDGGLTGRQGIVAYVER